MSRKRGDISGGYDRKTLSLPSSLVRRINAHLKTMPGSTISAFMTIAAEELLERRR